MQPAIESGGLGTHSRSHAVTLEFDDLSQTPFEITPQILTGTNHAPTLDPVGPLTASPGSELQVPLVAIDQDGDTLTFAIRGLANLPSGTLRADGTLVFHPAPNQLGNYAFDIVVSDGALEATRSVTLNVVADPITTTRVSGQVLQTNGQPLVGMQVEVGAIQGLTAADGSFELDLGSGPIVGDTIKVRGETFSGPLVYPFIAEKLAFVLEHAVFPGVNNVITRPIFLPPLDVAGGTTIDPQQDTMVKQEVAPGEMAQVFVAAGTLMNQQGTPFTGVLSITEVPPNLTPAALPASTQTGLVVTIQPGEMVFTVPAPLTLPNRDGWAPGTKLDLFSINPITGEFDDVGDALVSADGRLVETISGGIRNSSWHYVPPPPPKPKPPKGNPRNKDDNCDECPDSSPTGGGRGGSGGSGGGNGSSGGSDDGKSGGNPQPKSSGGSTHVSPVPMSEFASGYQIVDPPPLSPPSLFGTPPRQKPLPKELETEVGNHSGAVLGTRSLTTYVVRDQAMGMSLSYDSLRADPRPIVHFGFDNAPADSSMIMSSKISVARGNLVLENPGVAAGTLGLSGGEHLWSLPADGGNVNAALQLDLRELSSGQYKSTITQGLKRPANGGLVGSTSSSEYEFLHVNTMGSPFGAGWGIAGLQEIVENPNGSVLLINGDGSEKLFGAPPQANAPLQSPPGDFSTLQKLGDGTYRRTDENGTVSEFNVAHQLTTVTNRQGQATTFQYDAQQQLTGITDFTGQVTELEYTDGMVTAITDPTGRVTQLEHDAAGNLTKVTDPDGTSDEYEYDAGHHLTMKQDKLGRQEQLFYDFAGRLERSVAADGSERRFDPLQTQGLLPPTATTQPHDAPTAPVLGAPFAKIADPNGNVRSIQLDRTGQVVDGRDAVGRLPSVARNDNNLVTRATDARGHVTFYEYDANGNVTEMRDEVSGGGVLGSIATPSEIDTYTFEATLGQHLFFDAIRDYPGDVRVSLIAPSGNRLFSSTPAQNDLGPITVTEAGEYRLQFEGVNQNETGDFEFRLYSPTVTSRPLNLDTPINGRIDVPGEIDRYTFTGSVGQRLFFNSLANPAGDIRLSLVGPTGERLMNFTSDGNDVGTFILDEPGEYQLLVQGNGDNTGDYSFRYVTPTIITVPLQFDTDVNSSISEPGEIDRYTFTGSVGQRLFFNSLANPAGDIRLSLVGPTGERLMNFTSDGNDVGTFILDEPGEYQLLVQGNGDNTGDYSFRYVTPTIITVSLQFDTDVNSSISEPGEIDRYTFTGSVGQRLFFNSLANPAGDIRLSLVGPTGKRLMNFSPDGNDFGTIILDQPGEYQLLVQGNGDNTGDYSFRYVTPTIITVPLQFDTDVNSSISEPGEIDLYTFTGTVGQRLFFNSLANPPGDIRLSLIGPTGERLMNFSPDGNDFGTIILDQPGEYQLLVQGNGDNSGDYSFRYVTPTITTAPLLFDTDVNASISEPGEVDIYTFVGSVGQRIIYDSLATFPADLRVSLIEPTGARMLNLSASDNDSEMLTLDEPGLFQLQVQGSGESIGPYQFRLLDAATTSVTLATPITGSLVANGDQLFNVTGLGGQRLLFDTSTTGAEPATWTFHAPGGLQLFGTSLQSDNTVTLPFDGDYTLTLHNFGAVQKTFASKSTMSATRQW